MGPGPASEERMVVRSWGDPPRRRPWMRRSGGVELSECGGARPCECDWGRWRREGKWGFGVGEREGDDEATATDECLYLYVR
jgi:hypothetical protein